MRVALWLGWCGLLLAVSPIGSVGDDAVSQESKSERRPERRRWPFYPQAHDRTAPPGSDQAHGADARRDAGRDAQGDEGLQGRTALLRAQGQARLLGQLCVDPKGRLIVSDQYGPLYRITPPRHSAARPQSTPRSKNSTCRSAGRTACSGHSTASTSWSTRE